MSDRQITEDLMTKIADDVSHAMRRTLELAPRPRLIVAMAGGSAAIGTMAACLQTDADRDSLPDRDCILLAALLCAHCAINPGHGVEDAYRDLEILKGAANGR